MCKKKKIKGFEDYSVCKCGTVYSKKGFPLKPYLAGENEYQYHNVSLTKDGKTYRKRVNRLIYGEFSEIPDGYDVHHIDSNKLNNSFKNLRAIRKSENCLYRKRKDESKYGRNINYHRDKFIVLIRYRGQQWFKGRYSTHREAIDARDAAWGSLMEYTKNHYTEQYLALR